MSEFARRVTEAMEAGVAMSKRDWARQAVGLRARIEELEKLCESLDRERDEAVTLVADGTRDVLLEPVLRKRIEELKQPPPEDTARLLPAKPEVVVLCGSSRFVAEMAVIAWCFERDEGKITMGLHLLPQNYADGADIPDHLAEHEGVAKKMDELHWRKIDLADRIFVVNIGGYIGDSTRAEIEYAKRTGKPVTYLEEVP